MPNRKVTYRLYPNAEQEARLQETLGLHQRLYNTALEERIRVYQETGKGLSFAAQCKVLTQWRKAVPALAGLNAQSEQVTLKRLHLAFQHFFRRMKNGETPGFPRFKNIHRYPGWGYKTHGDGWKLHLGISGKHGALYLQSVGNLPIRGKPRTPGRPVTCEIMHKAGKWYASVTLEVEAIQRACGTEMGAFDWGLKEFLTIATPQGIETVANPRHLRNQLAELKRLGQEVSRKIRMAQKLSGRQRGFSVSANLRRAIQHLARLHAKVARQRKDFMHQTSAWLVKRFGAIGTEALAVKNMMHNGGAHKKGLNREIHAAAPAAFLKMTRTKAEEAGSWYEEAPTREIKPTQRCHACWKLPDEKKTLSNREHQCPHCGVTCGRDENAALVLLRWLEMRLAGGSGLCSPQGAGREPSEMWSGGSFAAMKLETHAIAV
ncbi:RNA-guided endonuclease InsQ/TnpB family protein [Acidithiobacillus albertensis]|uniref:RNA-guided endonuclease InsQ/TnpB family protein n=1 Tax=Acidithiobacillus albertensis TaxID=119978 RepID=UPI001C07E1AC|nr:RNA-guided endonuclease TnpB family protein [Acidithiobacillus albertensis]MBU2742984.1 transposase [Acidithiobacillus albertensis]